MVSGWWLVKFRSKAIFDRINRIYRIIQGLRTHQQPPFNHRFGFGFGLGFTDHQVFPSC